MTRARRRSPAVVAGLGAAAAVAAITGVAAARGLRPPGGEDPFADVDVSFPVDRERIVMSADGVPLHVREVGPSDAPITVLFAHGFTLRAASWVLVRNALQRRWGDGVRMVFPDCRGHGDSGSCSTLASVTVLGDDIAAVLAAVAPAGPVVLVGHSMGGMAIFGFAAGHPALVGDRVVGAALLGTASHALTDGGVSAALRNPALDVFRAAVRFLPSVVGRGRTVIAPIAERFVSAGAYGRADHSRAMAHFSSAMSLSAPLDTMAGFTAALEAYDERGALPILRRIETLVVCGDRDWMTPLPKSTSMAAELDCELIVLADTGHMLILEAADRVAGAIADLVSRAAPR